MIDQTGAPRVSIVILNYNHPEVIDVCLRTLEQTAGIDYEVIVVDNGSADPESRPALLQHQREGRITTLVCNAENLYFSGGNNTGVRKTNPSSEYILLLNSDVGFLREDWLVKLVRWMEGNATPTPTIWASKPTPYDGQPLDIVSAGWSHDANVDGNVRPEGWCCMFRRSVWRDLSEDMPWHYGFEEAVALSVRAGARCGVLFNYAPYMIHREGGSGRAAKPAEYNRQPDLTAWFSGITIKSLDFTLGPDEHSSYLSW